MEDRQATLPLKIFFTLPIGDKLLCWVKKTQHLEASKVHMAKCD